MGVFGRQGRGVCDHFGLTDEVDLIMGTFSKSLASIGGFIAADSTIIDYLRHTARTYIFSASNSPAATACALEALRILQREPERLEALWEVTNYALKRFKEEGFEIGDTESPIIRSMCVTWKRRSPQRQWLSKPVSSSTPLCLPACHPTDTLVRIALMATHTHEQVDRAVEALVGVFRKLEIIK